MNQRKNTMVTDTEISQLWQFAHLKFHYGEEPASNAMSSPMAVVEPVAITAETPIAGAVDGNGVPQESRKESNDLGMLESSKRDDEEISYIWQFAHLKFHFGDKLVLSMTTMTSGTTPVEAVAGNDVCQASRKEPTRLLIPNSAIVIA